MKRIASKILSVGLIFQLCIWSNAQQAGIQQQIVPDGKTNTTVKVQGKTTNITTSTVQGTVAYNSFSTFNVAAGNTVDLVLPSGTVDLLNLVNSQAINIWGVLNSIQNGKIGGNVLFADPFGMVVGKSGSINVGALMLVTPTKAFMESLFTDDGAPSAANTSSLLSGAVPISPDGMILVQGKINTISDAVLVGQNVTNSGKIASGAVFASSQPDFSDVVNVNGLVAGTALSTQNGNIEIVAQQDFQNSGEVSTNGANGLNAGNISIQAGNNITLGAGSLISASGIGQNSNAGSIKIIAGNNSDFEQGATIAASGGNISGNGGAIEFSAQNTVTLSGGNFEAGALHGQAGSVLIDPTTTDITSSVSTGGADYTNSGDTLLVEPGVTINTQQVGGNSGNITLNATNMNIGNCTGSCAATVLDASASAPAFTAGDVTLAATSTVSKTWDPSSPDANFNVDQASASIILSPNAVIRGQDITITATATSSKTVNLTETPDGSQAQAPDALCILVGGAGSCGSNTSPVSITDNVLGMAGNQYSTGDNAATSGWAGGVVSKATSNIQVEGGAQITATGKVTIDAEASSTASMTANGLYFTYAESDASATAQVQSGATINAAGDFDLTAHSVNNLTNTGQAVSGQPNLSNPMVTQLGPAIAVTYSVGNSNSVAGVESGATVNADNVNVLAKNENSFQTQATPSVDTSNASGNQQFGDGVAIAISNTSSSADAHLNGTVNAAGAITSDAESLDTMNQTTADAEVNNDSLTGNDNADDAVKYFQKKLGSNSSSNPGSNAQDSSPAFELGAALVIVNDSNTASSTVGANAAITSGAGQAITIKANASDMFSVAATGSADQASASIGGAVAITTFTNSATASVGQGATVDAGGALDVNATAELPNSAAEELEGIETYLENFNVSGSVSDLKSWVSSLGNDLTSSSGIENSIITPIKNTYDAFTGGLSSSLSSVGQPAESGVGVAGTVNLLTANNTATAFVDQNATVNAQSATVNATATTESVNAAGTAGAQQMSLFQKVFGSENPDQSLGGFGGTYSGITYNNTANSFIAGGASVTTTGGDVDVTSSATNFMADKFASGAKAGGGDIALSGAISNITINSNSYASIDDTAVINASGNVKVDAENSTRVYEIGDNTDSAATVGLGVVLGFTNVNNTTEGFIGNNDAVTGETTSGPAGSVSAGGSNDVSVIANAYERLVALDASSVSNANSKSNSGASGTTNTPSSGSTGGTNNTSDSNPTSSASSYQQGDGDGFGISGDIAFNNVTDITKGYISDGVTVKSTSTSVAATDTTLLLAADGGLVRESTAGLQAAFADNSINKTTEAYTNGVTIDTGSLAVTSNSSDIAITAAAGGAGGSGSSSDASIAGSVDFNDITNFTTATVANTTVNGQSGPATGDVTISADNRDTIFSIAGAFTYSSGDVGIGVSLDLGVLNNTVQAGVGSGSAIHSNGNVAVTASGDENQLSVSADLAVTGDSDIAASVSDQQLTKNVDAYIANNATVNTSGGSVTVAANDDQGGSSLGLPSGLIEIAGSFGQGSSDLGLGASASVNSSSKTISASIGNSSSVNASGDVDVTALTNDNLYLFAGGGGYGETAGFMGSAIFNTVTNDTSATIGSSTVTADNVNVNASDSLNVVDAAGGFAGSNSASVGAGGDIEVMGTGGSPLTVSASIGSGANVTAANNVNVSATQNQSAVSIAADAGFSGDATVIGSGTVLDYNTDTTASSNGNVNAGGTLDVNANRETNLTTVAGQAALGGSAGIGIAVSFIDKSDTVSASVGGGTDSVGGLQVSATGNDTLTPVAAGGALSEAVGVAGSAVVNILNPTTDAYISGASVTAGNQGVAVESNSNTNLVPSVAGAIGLGIDVGAATAADVTTISKNTTAEVGFGANLNSTGDVTVAANSEDGATSAGLSAAGGVYAGVAVAGSVYIINDNTNALVDSGATIRSVDSVGVSSNDQTDLDLLEGHVSGGIAGVGAALAFADVTKNTNARVNGSVVAEGNGSSINADNGTFAISYAPFGSGAFSFGTQVPNSNSNFFSNPMFQGERRASPNTSPVNGLAVTATSENDFNTVAAGAAGGFVGVVANGSILLLNNNTKSEIGSGANIGTGTDSVLVAAGTDVGHIGSALGVAGGFVGAGAGFDVSIIGNNTTADITNATVNAGGNVAVNANASEDVLSLVAGVSGGFVGGTGSVSVSELNDTTKAYISGNSVNAGGNLSVNSNDASDVLLLVGAVGGGAVGVGGSVAVDLINKNTEAFINNGTNTSAGGSTTVAANSSEQLSDGTIAGGGGVFAGAAGSVSVESDNSATSATVGTGTDTAGNGLTVSAQNTANATTFNGTIAGALFGATAGSVDVGNIENPTSAEISGANVTTTGGNVNVSATETRNINSQAISFGAAIGSIQASVIDWGVSAGVNTSGAALSSGQNPLDGSSYGGSAGTVYGAADSQSNSATSQGSGMLSEFGGGSAGQQAQTANSNLGSSTGGSPVTVAVTQAPPSKGTTAEIFGGSVNSAGAVNVKASDTTNMSLSAGGADLGVVGIGASVDIASVNTSSTAEIIGGSQISAGGNVVIDAARTENLNGQALGGNGGLIFGGGAAVTVVNDNGATDAEMEATVSQSSGLQVTASTLRNDDANSGQASAGAVAAGYSYASVNEGGSTTAQIDGGSLTLPAVQSVQVSADDNSTGSANSTGLTAGIVSVGGAEADTTINPTVTADIDPATVNTAAPTPANPGAGTVQVLASAEEVAYSNVTGVNASAAASIGTGSNANANAAPSITAYIEGTVNAGGNVTVAARYNYGSSDTPLFYACNLLGINACADVAAQATGSAGSLLAVAGNGSNANANSLPSVNAYLAFSNVKSAGNVSVESESASSVYTNANNSSAALGLNLPGDTNATSQISNSNTAFVQSSQVTSSNFLLSAESYDDAVGANATGSGLGLLSEGNTNANTRVGGNTVAQLTGTSTINATNDASILATVSELASTDAQESVGGLGAAASTTAATGNVDLGSNTYYPLDTPQVSTQAGTNINANTSTLKADLAEALFSASSNTDVYSGAGDSNATTWVFVPVDPTVTVNGNISAPQMLSLIATVNNNPAFVNTYGYADAHLTGVTGYRATGTDDNTTDFEPSVSVNGSTLTTDNLYVEASTPVPPSGSNPYWSNYANGTSDCLCLPGDSNSEGQYTYGPGTGITLNATIIEPGTPSPQLTIDANANETGNITAPKSEDDIVVPNLINTSTASITLYTPSGFTAGTSTVHDDTSWQTVTITNYSGYDLVINSIQPFADSGTPTVAVVSDPTRNNAVFNFTTDNTPPVITITNASPTADTDIYLNGTITDPTGNVTMSALLGSILQNPNGNTNETEATNVSLTANHGDIGSAASPLNLTLATVDGGPTATLNALAGQDLYANVTPLEQLKLGDSVPANVPVNFTSLEAGDNIGLALNPATALLPQLGFTTITIFGIQFTIPTYTNSPYTVNGLFNLTQTLTAGGNVLVSAPANTTLNLDPGSTIISGFANIGVNIASNGTVTGSPIPVNYTSSVDSNNVVMQSLQQQGGNVTIAGGGALTGTGTINVLNGYSNVNVTNNSNANLVMNNLSFDTPVTGTVSIFGANQSLNDGNYAGTSIALTETNNAKSTISITQNGTSGDLQVAGAIQNQSGTTSLTAVNTNIVNTGGSSELVESNFINLNAAKGQIGSSGTPINVQVDSGYVNANAQNDIALDQVTGNLNVGTITSTNGNVYLTAAGSILDAPSTVSGGNLVLDAIAGSIGTSGTPLSIDATGTLTGQAQTGAFITETAGPMNVNNVTSNTGNITLTASNGNVNLGTNSVDALAPNTSPASVVTINANGNINDSSTSTAISGDTIVLNSTSTTGNIGTSANPIEVRSSLNASGVISGSTINGNSYVNESVGAMNVGTITSTGGTVNLSTTQGPILNGDSILGNSSNVNVTAPNINLTSNGSTIGTSLNALDVNTTSSTGGLNATAPGDIYLTDTVGNLYLNSVTSTTAGNVGLSTTVGNVDLDNTSANGTINDLNGNTTITAQGSILNVAGSAASINTQGITLNAINGSIGTMATPLRIHSNAGTALATPAVVQALANLGIYLNQTSGPLYVSSITSSTSDIYIISDGSIFNGNSSSTAVDLTGNNINLTSNNGGIGSASRMLIVNNRNGTNTVSATATTTPTGHSLDMYANGATNGSIYVEESSGDLISSSMIESKTGNVDLLVNNGSAWINNINVSPFGNPATTNLGSTQSKTVTILVQGNVLNANTISSPDSLTMTVNPGTTWTTTPGTDTIRVGQADVFSTITARADNINMPLVYALNQGSLTNDISRQTEGLHFFVSGWGNPGGYNYLANLASNVNINVSPCPKGCSTIPAVVFNNLTTNYANITSGEDWFELVNAIIGTQGVFTTPYQTTTVTFKFPQQQSANRYAPFYIFNFGSYQETDANPPYWVMKDKTIKNYTLTQPLNTIFNDLIKYYALP